LPVHLLVQAMMAGSGFLLVMGLLLDYHAATYSTIKTAFLVALIVDLFLILVGEFGIPHASEVAATAAHSITHGKYKWHFWGGAIVLGHLVPMVLYFGNEWVGIIAGIFALVGLYLFEFAFVMAPQEVPNS
jgi:formate-dependent nitrite reductase membrane component NrfD